MTHDFHSLLTSAGYSAPSGESVSVSSLSCDSRKALPGGCYVAIRGVSLDGHAFLAEVIEKGVAAIVCEDASCVPADLREKVAWHVVDDSSIALGRLAQAWYGHPARKLSITAITGTNGKSTVAMMINHILREAGLNSTVLGTIQYQTGKRVLAAGMTTPGALDLAAMMLEMVEAEVTHLVLEASSHALDQNRLAGVEFDVAVFTNLTGDHLDYHQTMGSYFAAKRRLFEGLRRNATAVINFDDPRGEELAKATKAAVRSYGLMPLADVQGRIDEISFNGTEFSLLADGKQWAAHSKMIGRHNVFNSLAAACATRALGVDRDVIVQALGTLELVPGRLASVETHGDYRVFVDYAHTDDALVNVLTSLRPITPGRLIVVFGCGGDRDQSKRPRMLQAALDNAVHVVITSDNPRSEDPQAIVDDILAGADPLSTDRIDVKLDRHDAISCAITMARHGDVVLIAGKGHETYQIIGEQRLDFDDVQVAKECIALRAATRQDGDDE
ncbi:MAG: UDP-N-acetylmuramoyl-L-alanyl-D-glutamate--2,6-diaminopimelate ligase [Phycisphaerales bacterium]|jgi:UDP-N-acetylmuramoyl-L-alanyl-D-glutamate--2,6-diaminopimelate ligase|nr:UDP-N-acetylmuramoyl-L-alanyl-D-glutamate--2,6-diaminopimelate ligase [Phycisphaerales bacterium]MBT7170979.1 UDP-N-acetylmuramoyl-L-alanyl-D-glutamate--2,6-diaminopimelate ligase [Phycisphaerales bacterium]